MKKNLTEKLAKKIQIEFSASRRFVRTQKSFILITTLLQSNTSRNSFLAKSNCVKGKQNKTLNHVS